MIFINNLKKVLPAAVIKWQNNIRKRFYEAPLYRKYILQSKIDRVKRKPVISVLFIAYTPSMWKVDSLYRAMRNHPRFNVEILLHPNMTMSNIEARTEELQSLRDYFSVKGYHYVEWCDIDGKSEYDTIPAEYDILFYPQPWEGMIRGRYDFIRNKGRLFVCCNYAFHSVIHKLDYNKWYQNAAWLDLYENEVTYRLSCKEKYNRGINSVVTGLPIVDEFRRSAYHSPWKPQPMPCKKVIWAPHWTIGSSHYICYSNFLVMADYMLRYARESQGKVQFAFKPHPHLKRELYKHADWGVERTNRYYDAWEKGENTQLELGEYVDLFMTSDAMIHDSCSFCLEYMLTGKPVLFMVRNEHKQVENMNEMARAAFYSQYLGYSVDDVEQFLVSRVISSEDPKKAERANVVRTYLTSPNEKTAAQNIIDKILEL